MGIFSSIFGGSKQSSTATSTSKNQAYDTINQNFSPLFQNATSGASALQALLSGDTSGLDTYKRTTGFNALAEQGSRGITGNAAASGLLRSGSTGKRLVNYGTQLNNQFAGSYMDRLLQQAQLGFNAGNLVAGAGQTSTSQQQSSGGSNGGIGGFLGQLAGGIALSDRRAKTNIVKIGELPNSLNVYTFDYIDGPKNQTGVMAQEVAEIMPEALGPIINGYMTVDYDKVKEAA